MASLKNQNVFLALLITAFASCSRTQENAQTQKSIAVIDTLYFAFPEYSLQIVDYTENSHNYLGIASKRGVIAEYDSSGNRIALKYIGKDDLNIGRRGILSAGYLPNDHKVIETLKGYFVFDRDWVLLDSLYDFNNIRHKYYRTQGKATTFTGENTIWENLVDIQGGLSYSKEYFDTTKTLRSLSFKTKAIEHHLPFPKSTSFKDTLNTGIMPIIAPGFYKNELYIVFPIDPILYIYDFNEKILKTEVPLNLVNFDNTNSGIRFDQQGEHYHEGFELNTVFMNKYLLSARILSIKRTENFLYVIHKKKNPSNPQEIQLSKAIRLALLEDKKYVAIYDQSFNKIADLEVPTEYTIGNEFIPINDSTFVAPYGDFRRTFALPKFLKMRIKGLN